MNFAEINKIHLRHYREEEKVNDAIDIGEFERASMLARQRKRVIEELELLTGGSA